jgi:hypothetical protein
VRGRSQLGGTSTLPLALVPPSSLRELGLLPLSLHLDVPNRIVGFSYRSPFAPVARPFRSQLRVVSEEDETEDFGRGRVVASTSRSICKKNKPGEVLGYREDQSSRDDSQRESVTASCPG